MLNALRQAIFVNPIVAALPEWPPSLPLCFNLLSDAAQRDGHRRRRDPASSLRRE
jgi:hypothetical protein